MYPTKYIILRGFALLLLAVGIIACDTLGDNDVNDPIGSFTDSRDGKVYQTATIGSQVWMAENLAYLPSVVGPGTGSQTTPYYYVYDYDGTDVNAAKATSNYSDYGVLYNWTAAVNACPAGWHLPSELEWIELTDYLGGEDVAGGKLKEIGTSHWLSPNTGATNDTGFTALPGGIRNFDGSTFSDIGSSGAWWSSTERGTIYAWGRYMGSDYIYVGGDDADKEIGGYVRCLKD
ncbi:MAG: FISUMP domain-containing protein [Bacteroidota bacterium]